LTSFAESWTLCRHGVIYQKTKKDHRSKICQINRTLAEMRTIYDNKVDAPDRCNIRNGFETTHSTLKNERQ
jgi:hypothetical protein